MSLSKSISFVVRHGESRQDVCFESLLMHLAAKAATSCDHAGALELRKVENVACLVCLVGQPSCLLVIRMPELQVAYFAKS